MDDLNDIATSAMSESEPQAQSTATPETSSVQNTEKAPEASGVKPMPKVEKSVNTTQNSSQQQKLSRRQQAAKEASDYRLKSEAEITNANRKIQEYENRFKSFEPLLPFVTEIQKRMEEQKQKEAAELYNQNPQLAIDQRTQAMIQQAMAPFYQQAELSQRQQMTSDNLNYIKQLAGSEDNFKAVSPYMKQILDYAMQTNPDDADKLARNPEFLFRYARDIMREQQDKQNAQAQNQKNIENKQSKAAMAKFNGGISRPNKSVKINTTPTRETAKQDAYDFIKQITGQSR
jgi:hypothetical protein